MKRGPIRKLLLRGAPALRGTTHGATHRSEIRSFAADRLRLAVNGSWAGRAITVGDALALAEEMLPAHRGFDAELYEELEHMAGAAGISSAEALIVGGFTDFVDFVRARGGHNLPQEDDCTAMLVPAAASTNGPILAQTWDMHASATPHVLMLEIEPEEGPRALVFSTAGCIGQIGMNEAGIVVGISNLAAADGCAGVTWPFVVRKILAQRNLDDALACVLECELAGGRNFLLLNAAGRGYVVEAMPSRRVVRELADDALACTNHCQYEETRRLEAPRPADLVGSSEERLLTALVLLAARPMTVQSLMALLREPFAICRRSEPPHHNESSGAVILCPAVGDFWACWGIPADNEFELMRVTTPVRRPAGTAA